LLFVTEPVKKTPIQPKTGDSNGNIDPVFAITSPKALLKPAYVINFEITKIIHIVIIGNHNSLNVTLNKRVASNKLTCLDINIVVITTSSMAVPVCAIVCSGSVIAISAISLSARGNAILTTDAFNMPLGANIGLNSGALQIIT